MPLNGINESEAESPKTERIDSPQDAQPVVTRAIIVAPPTDSFILPLWRRKKTVFIKNRMFIPTRTAVAIKNRKSVIERPVQRPGIRATRSFIL